MKIAINVGHGPKDRGAIAVDGTTEFEFNSQLAILLAQELKHMGHTPVIIIQDSYSGLPAKINAANPDCVVSLHFNAEGGTGTETLYWYTSAEGKALAESIQGELVPILGLRDRGIKARQTGDLGALLLRGTKAPAVIVEPFFGDNQGDWEIALAKLPALALAIAKGLNLTA